MRTGRRERPVIAHVCSDTIALCCIGRLENRYAREFIMHYKSIGFDVVYVCDNNRKGEEAFDEVLSDFVRDGFVKILPYRDKVAVQRDSYADIYRRYGHKHAWMFFLDFDEYLDTDDVKTLMQNYRGYECVLFNWVNYGDGGMLDDDGRPLAERFSTPLPHPMYVQYDNIPENDHVKCALRGGLLGVRFDNNPHVPSSPRLRCCDAEANECQQRPFRAHRDKFAVIRHYLTKTVTEWAENKWKKGTGNKESVDTFRSAYAGRFFLYNEWTPEKEEVMRRCNGIPPYEDCGHRTVVIINFNTQKLTDATIRSLNKQTPGCDVKVVDNSDLTPYRNTFANVEVIDNTRGQLCDFGKMLDECPDKVPNVKNEYGSAKHCKTIDLCFDLFPQGFLLMDSDVLVKRDISRLFDSSCVWTGATEVFRSRVNVPLLRVIPYICYINVPMCREHGIRYFHPTKMLHLTQQIPDTAYDTGCWFYEACKNEGLPENYVSIHHYIEHFGHGSWLQRDEEEWLKENERYWK